jgi:hypothetical protein
MPKNTKTKSKSNKLTQDEVKSIVSERVDFEITLSLLNGLEILREPIGTAYTIEKGEDSAEIEGTKLLHNEDDCVTIRYNEKVNDRITKYLDVLLMVRGIKAMMVMCKSC